MTECGDSRSIASSKQRVEPVTALAAMERVGSRGSERLILLLNDLAELEAEGQDLHRALEITERARHLEDGLGPGYRGEDAARARIRTRTLAGSIRRALGEYLDAERDLLDAASMALAAFGDGSEDAACARNELGMLYKYWGRFEEGLELYERALDAIVGLHGADSMACATIHHNVGGILHARGDFAAAEAPARKAWDIARRLLGDDDPRTLAEEAAYAAVLDGLKRYDESERLYRRTLAVFEELYAPDHEEVAVLLHNLASVLAAKGAHEEAERHYRRALAIKEKLFGADSPDVALSCNNLGKLLAQTSREAEAVPILRRAVAILERRVAAEHPHLMAARRNLAGLA